MAQTSAASVGNCCRSLLELCDLQTLTQQSCQPTKGNQFAEPWTSQMVFHPETDTVADAPVGGDTALREGDILKRTEDTVNVP